ncbi:T9SS type A sorting domain-containing protein, partial [bacterium]|nr:T9SS type A sorting domain-containing protein [bacterium]
VIRRDTTYLADFRSDNSDEDYIVRDWIEIKGKGDYVQCHRLQFELQSSDTGIYGMNTPASFALELYFDIFSVQEERAKPSLSIYPNPSRNLININSDSEINEVFILDLKGSIVQTHNSNRFNVSDLTPGVYFIKIITENGVATSKFIKK